MFIVGHVGLRITKIAKIEISPFPGKFASALEACSLCAGFSAATSETSAACGAGVDAAAATASAARDDDEAPAATSVDAVQASVG